MVAATLTVLTFDYCAYIVLMVEQVHPFDKYIIYNLTLPLLWAHSCHLILETAKSPSAGDRINSQKDNK